MKNPYKLFSCLFIILFILLSGPLSAEGTRRALIIGIDIYLPGNVTQVNSGRTSWINLDGCVNDAMSIKTLLASKYGFGEDHISLLTNEKATREGIINCIKRLTETSQKGDIVVIYYAGHGSQIRNIASSEADQKDETIVPSDAYLGAADIRDKEINELFYQLSEKGVILTAIFDSCHSGSISRGLADHEPKSRYLAPVPNARVNDPVIPHDLVSENVLIISAAQDEETAKEQEDEQGNPHGAFTFALIQALMTLPPNAPAIKIIESTRAIIKYNGKLQEPVFEGNDRRKNSTLTGLPRESVPNTFTVAVLKNEDRDSITLQGGYISGIRTNCKLTKIYDQDTLLIKVTQVNGANSSLAKVIKGDFSKIKAGDMFQVTEWALEAQNALKVYIPSSEVDYNALSLSAHSFYSTLKSNNRIKLITDPTIDDSIHTVFYNGKSWMLHKDTGESITLGKGLSGSLVHQTLPSGGKVFLSLPAFKSLGIILNKLYKRNLSISVTQNSAEADYVLSGRFYNDVIEYAFISATPTTVNSLTVLPVRTNFVKLSEEPDGLKKAADTLMEYSDRIAKIKAWLTLASPPDDGTFPYYLALRNAATGKVVSSGSIMGNEIYGLILVKDTVNAKNWDGSRRFVYVSSIDSRGKSTLMFPLSNVENHYPIGDELPDTIFLGRRQLFRVAPPFGYDHYILLALDEQIPNVDLFNSEAVRTRGSSSPLLNYLVTDGVKSRGNEILVSPSSWKKQVVTVRSRSK
ncbi:MAG: caspase family protein [Bacteroidales bacterium]